MVVAGDGRRRTWPSCGMLRGTAGAVTRPWWHGAVAGLAQGARLPSRAEAGLEAWRGPGQALSLPHYTSVAGPHS